MKPKRIALLVGRGSRVPYILKSAKTIPNLEIVFILSCVGVDVGVLAAREYGVEARCVYWVFYKKYPIGRKIFTKTVLALLERRNIDFIVMAGWRVLMPKSFIEKYRGRIINVHPSLLPKYPGNGEKAVTKQWKNRYKNKKAGCTLHFVDEGMDTGKPILQYALDSTRFNSKEELAEAIHKKEERILCEGLELIAEGKI